MTKRSHTDNADSPTCFIRSDGQLAAKLPIFAHESAVLVKLYGAMLLTRTFDEKAVALQRTGRLGTFASSLGQEAVSIGTASAMRAEDILLPSFREQGAMLWRGVSPRELFLYWGGDERGSDFAGPRGDFPICIPVASHAPHAAGAALAIRLRQEARVAVAIMGDGATSKGDFYEALNVAGVWRLPVVFVIANNQWAISVPVSRQTAAKTLAHKAAAAGIASARVDGNDVVAVRAVVAEALDRALGGEGATLIEALTYRLSDHTTVDDARRYRSDAEVSEQWPKEPIARLRGYLINTSSWSKADEEALITDCRERIERAANEYLSTPPLEPDAIFEHSFTALPKDLLDQRRGIAMAKATGPRHD